MTSPLPLEVDIFVARGGFELSFKHSFPPGTITAIIGPNGAGKTTILESVAGFINATKGTILLGETCLLDTTRNPAINLAPHRRGSVSLGQKPSLFPHLSVADNIGFGPASHGLAKKVRSEEISKWASRLNLDTFLLRRPNELSSGQQQRVALARALAASPSVMLLDEPTTALDVDAAKTFRSTLKAELQEHFVTTLLVSHTIEDVLGLADFTVVLESGKIVDQGPASKTLFRPQTQFAANFAGLNRLEGIADQDTFTVDGVFLQTNKSGLCGNACAAIAPTAIKLQPFTEGREGVLPPNTWVTKVLGIDAHLFGFAIELAKPKGLWAQVSMVSLGQSPLVPGQAVSVTISPEDLSIYSAK
jgi:ABC-type spermidine/putrescine transport systems, ATPase components